ncbi:MAG TPA: plasmid pRiA4b ORF-3 family protein [Amycolatopsis sp.]|uniref:plasmid pRiA4b ORF-3 family protein n=1 Tax=Amycolatopsis sp. TaxID=37632 RepID=UPI002B45E295|nr:plasmid pRiA4b ORF-3 family protein [Amycolatopsis sp.]HKS48906.1 plasmid pRiA4b ORF-3 family protein [Amycolatopsis sp.]
MTTRGVLKPAAAVEACDVLGIELPTRRPRSALDIDELMMAWAVASTAGFVEVDRGRATADAALRAWTDATADAVLAVWTRCVLEFFGLAGESNEPDPETLGVLVVLHERGGAVSLDDLDAGIADVLGDATPGCSCPSCTSATTTGPGMVGLPDELYGMTGVDGDEIVEIVEALGEFGIAVLRGEGAELTPLGRWFTDFLFRQNAPAPDADAATLVDAVVGLPNRIAVLMARPWLAARPPIAAARELIATGEPASGQQRLTALALARECGPDAAPAWREWAATDGFGAYARVWLAEQTGTEPAETDTAWITVDALDIMLGALPPDLPLHLMSGLFQAQAGAELAEILPLLANCGHPAASRLITLLTGRPVGAPVVPARTPVLRPATAARPGARYQIKVALRGVTKPPVWRRLEVPADLDLGQLHAVIQAAMGWQDCHLHVFSAGGADYGRPDPELGHTDERAVRPSQLLAAVGDRLLYTYDFGDGWEHDITLEKILPADAGAAGATCTAGRGACPPEDCGGVWGYQELKATLADPNADEHESMLDWLGLASSGDFDPRRFSTEDANHRLDRSTRQHLRSVR